MSIEEMVQRGIISPEIGRRLGQGRLAVAVAWGPNAQAIARATRPVRVVAVAGPGERVVKQV